MFSWICPICGKEVPPSKTECPSCVAAGRVQPGEPQAQAPQSSPSQMPVWRPPAPPAPPPPPPSPPTAYPPQYAQPYPPAPPPQYAQQPYAQPQPPQPQYAQPYPPQYAPPAKSAPPAWLIGVGAALGLLVLFGGIYFMMTRNDSPVTASSAPKTSDAAATPDGKSAPNPLAKQIEVTGLRFVTVNKVQSVKFLVVNHSGAEVADLAASVDLKAGTTKADAASIGSFNFRVDSIGPGESKDVTVPLKTAMKPYELPDWQAAFADVTVTSPAP